MKLTTLTRMAVLLALTAACACRGEPAGDLQAESPDRTLVGQLLLPSGTGSRGVEVLVDVAPSDGESHTVWVLFDEQGHFSHSFTQSLANVKVTAGIGREVFRIETADLVDANHAGQIDVGVIDLRDRLREHRMVLRAAVGQPGGDVRAAMWSGTPPVGPMGEPVALGSRQFPQVVLGSEVQWLVPDDAQEIYFLVERPDGPGRGRKWWSGEQQLFGPFTADQIPAELVLE